MAEKQFVSESAFSVALEQRLEEKKTAVAWEDLLLDTVYKITQIDKRISVYGVCYILHLRTQDGTENTVFAPRSLVDDFRQRRKPGYSPYMISLGVETYKVNRHKKHKFELVFIHEPNAAEVTLDDEPPN